MGLALRAGKRPRLFFRVEDTTRNIIKMGALRDDLIIISEGTSEIISHSGEIITTLGAVYLTLEKEIYHFLFVGGNYLVRAEGVISREIPKKENLEEMAITGPLNDQTMTMKHRHDQGNNAPLWAQIEKHELPSQSKSGNYVSEPHNPPSPQSWQFQNGWEEQTGNEPG